MLKEEYRFYITRCNVFLSRIKEHRFSEYLVLKAECGTTAEPVVYQDRLGLSYRPIGEGEKWGDAWDSAWFHLTADVPEAWQGKELACELTFSGEALIFDEQGVPEWSLTGQSCFDTNAEKSLYFPRGAHLHDGKMELWIEAAANTLTGLPFLEEANNAHCEPKFPGNVNRMRLGVFNREAWNFYYDFEVLFDLFNALPEGDYRRVQFLTVLNDAINVYGGNAENAAAARAVLRPLLERPAMASANEVTAIGHAHIDLAWLWHIGETKRKVARTFASQLRNIADYPGYIFGESQPQMYAWCKENYPELYAKVKEAVAAGRWEVQGGMWVEADCNLVNGESLVRQFLHGKNFFKDEFGVEVKNLWLPDVFGYAANLPQIIRKSGCDYFLTQKISWNQINRFPYHSFTWEGIDGSEVLAHFPPGDTYNVTNRPSHAVKTQNNNGEADVAPMMVSLFGIGDGGGGPSEMHLERLARIANLEGCPRQNYGTSLDFFKKLDALRTKLPHWRGELYLEMHRGTLTTQAKTKMNNRRLEQDLVALEFLACCLPADKYPREELDRIWKEMLCLQFHDIIPGSSIHRVYEEAEAAHGRLRAEVKAIGERLMDELDIVESQNAMVVVNSLPYPYTDYVELPENWRSGRILSSAGVSAVQIGEDGKSYALVTLPPSCVTMVNRIPGGKSVVKTLEERVLENEVARYEFNDRGELIRGYDKEAKREILRQGQVGNWFRLEHDRPITFDAWDVDITKGKERGAGLDQVEVSPVTAGPVFSRLQLRAKIGNSAITQAVTLRKDSKRLDFETTVDWNEEHKLLYVRFPVDVFAQDAVFDIQYGYLKRPMNSNTSWEKAKFEVCGQRYADISEPGFGVALLNDCKYGYKTNEGNLELTLLRSPMYPDATADRGVQHFTYSLLPHGTDSNYEVLQEAAMLNRRPLLKAGGGCLRNPVAFWVEESLNITLEVIKRAEKSDAYVLRLVENSGSRGTCNLCTLLTDVKLTETNLIEWERGNEYSFENGEAKLSFKPFEIRTFLVEK